MVSSVEEFAAAIGRNWLLVVGFSLFVAASLIRQETHLDRINRITIRNIVSIQSILSKGLSLRSHIGHWKESGRSHWDLYTNVVHVGATSAPTS